MINAFSPVKFKTSDYTPNFTGNKYRKAAQTLYDSFSYSEPCKIEKKLFNYSLEHNSQKVRVYDGPMEKTAGFSTENPELGGGWLEGSIDTPLSTTGVQTCALLNLVNMETLQQVLYHVFHETSAHKIEDFIRKIFPDFTHVNIVGGQQFKTVNTMRKIADAVDNVNAYAPKTYYHTVSNNPELVAYNGDICYVKGKSGQLSFIPNDKNYWY